MTSAVLIDAARAMQPDLTARTAALVRIDSQTPPSATGPVADAAAQMLREIPGVTVELVESVAPVMNLVARLDGGGGPGPKLVLSGHLDTYPIGEGAWTRSPLGGDVVDGRLYGRGSADMKGACVCLIGVMRLLAERVRPFPGEVVLVLAGDEERMGELGTQWLIDHRPEVRGDGVIVADVGGPRSLRLGEKGMIWLEIDAEGRQAHGAHVHAGVNAADRLIDALTALRGLERLAPSSHSEAAAVIAGAAKIDGADGPAARDVMRRVTVNLGVLSGGVSANLAPAHAQAGVDVRIPLGLSAQAVEGAAAEILGAHDGLGWRVTRRYDPTWTSPDAPIAVACRAGAQATLGEPVWFDMRIGGSDARLWRRAGFDTVTHGLTPFNLGAPDEHCLIDELWRLTACHAHAAVRFLGAT